MRLQEVLLCTRNLVDLLFRLANYYRARTIIELGSSLGISTAYLASADSSSRVITMEGSPAIASIAQETFQKLELEIFTSRQEF